MRKRKDAKSLRATLFALCIAVILVMSLLLGGSLISQHRAIASLSSSLRTIDTFYLFNTLLNRFHQSFNLYANSLSRHDLQDCYDQLKALGETARNMAGSFPQEASIIKNQSLIEQYIASSRSLLEEGATLTEPEFWSRLDQSGVMLGEINDNVQKVQSFYLENISRLSAQSMRDWQTQLHLSLAVALVSLTLLLLFIHRCIEGVTSPILRLAQYAQKIAEGDFSQRFQPPITPEIKEISLLSRAFASMA